MTRARKLPAALRVKVRVSISSGVAPNPATERQEPGQEHRGLAGARGGLQVKTLPGVYGPLPGVLVLG